MINASFTPPPEWDGAIPDPKIGTMIDGTPQEIGVERINDVGLLTMSQQLDTQRPQLVREVRFLQAYLVTLMDMRIMLADEMERRRPMPNGPVLIAAMRQMAAEARAEYEADFGEPGVPTPASWSAPASTQH